MDPETLPQHSSSLSTCAIFCPASTPDSSWSAVARAVCTSTRNTPRNLKDLPTFPAEFKPLAEAQGKALEDSERPTWKWTFISPAADFQADGERVGSYETAGEEPATLLAKSYISYVDYAIAVVNEAEQAAHVGERFSVYAK